MADEKLVFSLRLALRFNEFLQEDIRLAMDYALEAGYDDICLFTPGEEANRGFFTPEELEIWLGGARLLKEKAQEAGLSFSVNIWNTMLHTDRGRKLRPGQDFTRMVDSTGKQAEAVACPLCENWREWLLWAYSTIAGELKPDMLWVEDDFRLHNHEPLDWGGCFCSLHMEEYSKRAGKSLDRNEFYSGIVSSGEPNPYREIWLRTHRDTLIELAGLLENAVHKESPATKLGLMSSVPEVHAIEGREWSGLLRALAGENHPPLDRVHLPSYSEMWAAEYMRLFNQAAMHTRACIPKETLVMPELENYTFSRFIKSDAFTAFQMQAAAPLRLGGMMVDVFDIGGGGIFFQDGAAKAVKESREFIRRLNETGVFSCEADGVKVLTSTASSAFLHTEKGMSLDELRPKETFWAALLGTFSIPFSYCTDSLPKNSICAVSGQFFRSIGAAELKELFAKNKILMTGEAAEVLCELGFGYLAGIKSCRHIPVNTGIASYEQAAEDYFGVSRPRCSAQSMTGDYYKIDYSEAEELSEVFSAYDNKTGPGVAVVKNHTAVLPYGNFGEFMRSHFHPVRGALMAQALKALGLPLLIENARNLFVYSFSCCEKTAVYLVNAQLDTCDKIELYSAQKKLKKAYLINKNGTLNLEHGENEIYVKLEPLECALLMLEWW